MLMGARACCHHSVMHVDPFVHQCELPHGFPQLWHLTIRRSCIETEKARPLRTSGTNSGSLRKSLMGCKVGFGLGVVEAMNLGMYQYPGHSQWEHVTSWMSHVRGCCSFR